MKAPPGLSCSVPERLMDRAVGFHGHLGAFLVLGLKAGLFANEVLGKDGFKTRTIVETEPFPPCSCIVDGIQVATGCTMGKGSIEIKSGSSLSVTFAKSGKSLRLSLRVDILEKLRKISSKDGSKQTALMLLDEPIRELFEIG